MDEKAVNVVNSQLVFLIFNTQYFGMCSEINESDISLILSCSKLMLIYRTFIIDICKIIHLLPLKLYKLNLDTVGVCV